MSIILNDNIDVFAPKPTDARYSDSSGAPYASVSAVNTAIVSSRRYVGLTVNVAGVEYWYASGILDGDLVIKSSGGGGGTVTSVSGLAPLFTVSNPTTTPTFALSNAAATSIFGNFTSGSAAPSYNAASADGQFLVRRSGALTFGSLVAGDIPTLSQYELVANKATSFATLNNALYPTTQAVDNGYIRLTGDNRIGGDLYATTANFEIGNQLGGNYLQFFTSGNFGDAGLYRIDAAVGAGLRYVTNKSSGVATSTIEVTNPTVGLIKFDVSTTVQGATMTGGVIYYNASRISEILLSPNALTSKEYADSRLRGFTLAAPIISNDQQSIRWNNTSQIWEYYTPSSGGGGTTTNAVTFNSGGTGDASGTTFNGSVARTISYNSIGAAPATAGTSILKGNGSGGFSNVTSSDILSTISLTSANIFVGNGSNNPQAQILTLNASSGVFGLSNTGVLTVPDSTASTRGFFSATDYSKNISAELIGTIFTDSFTRADSASLGSNYTQSGTTMSILSNKLRMTNASGSLVWTNKAAVTGISRSNSENIEVSGTLTIPTLSATTFGASIGFESTTLPTYGQSFEVRFAMETANVGKIIFYRSQNTVVANIPVSASLPISSGDLTSFKVSIVKNEVIVTWTNLTAGSNENKCITQSYAFDFGRTTVIGALAANSYYINIFSHGGTIDLDDFSIVSKTKKGGTWIMGDSITKGFSYGDISKRPVDILQENYLGNFTCYASGNLRIEELTQCVTDIVLGSPDEIIFAAGVNNIRAGESAATIVGRIGTFLTALNAVSPITYVAGTNFFVCALVPQGAQDVTTVNAAIEVAYPTAFIDLDTPLRTNTSSTPNSYLYNIDAIHPNYLGGQRMAETIAVRRGYKQRNSNKIKSNFLTYTEAGYVGIGTETPQTSLDLVDTKSQLRLSTANYTSTDKGMYALGLTTAGNVTWGVYYDGTNFIAKDDQTSSITFGRNALRFFADTGLTIGNTVSQTQVATLTKTGFAIGNTTPAYALELVSANSAFHLNSTTADTGGWIQAVPTGLVLSGNNYYNGTTFVAKSTSPSSIAVADGYIEFRINSGLTIGNTFTLNPVARFDVSSNFLLGMGTNISTTPASLTKGIALANGTAGTGDVLGGGLSMVSVSNGLYIRNNGGFIYNLSSLGMGIGTGSPQASLHTVQGNLTSGFAPILRLDSGTQTNITAGTELFGVNINLSATKTWLPNAITTQREVVIQAPTYAFVSTSTITNAATLAITAAPTAGTNATITNNYALWIQSGLIGLAASTTSAASLRIPSGTAPTSPNDGDNWYDSTRKTLARRMNTNTGYVPHLLHSNNSAVTITNTTTETTVFTASTTLGTNFFASGKVIRIKGGGIYSTPLAASLAIKVKLGSTVIGTVTTTAIGNSATNLGFQFESELVCYTTGATGTIQADGHFNYATASTRVFDDINNAGNAVTVDTTATQVLDVTVQWDGASTTRSIKITNAVIEVLF